MTELTQQECTQFRAEQKAQRDAYFKAKQSNLKTVTTRVAHECAGCHRIISEKTKAKVCAVATVYGTNPGLRTDYYCLVCRPDGGNLGFGVV